MRRIALSDVRDAAARVIAEHRDTIWPSSEPPRYTTPSLSSPRHCLVGAILKHLSIPLPPIEDTANKDLVTGTSFRMWLDRNAIQMTMDARDYLQAIQSEHDSDKVWLRAYEKGEAWAAA